MTQDFDIVSEEYTATNYFDQNSCLPTWVVIENSTEAHAV